MTHVMILSLLREWPVVPMLTWDLFQPKGQNPPRLRPRHRAPMLMSYLTPLLLSMATEVSSDHVGNVFYCIYLIQTRRMQTRQHPKVERLQCLVTCLTLLHVSPPPRTPHSGVSDVTVVGCGRSLEGDSRGSGV